LILLTECYNGGQTKGSEIGCACGTNGGGGGDRKVYGFFDVANVRKRTMEDLGTEGLSKGHFEFVCDDSDQWGAF